MKLKPGWILILIGMVLLLALLVLITDGIAQEEPGGASDIVPVFNTQGAVIETVQPQNTQEFVPPNVTATPTTLSLTLPPLSPPPDCDHCANFTPGPDGPPPLSTPIPPTQASSASPASDFGSVNWWLEFLSRIKQIVFRK